MTTFTVDIGSFINKAKQNAVDVAAGTALDLSKRVILRTPVDTGRARGNWIPSINVVSTEVRNISPDAGSEIKAPAESKASQIAIGNVINVADNVAGNIFYLTNNLPYIRKLEFGSSQQSPAGMVRVSIQELLASLDRIVAENT